jgi:hypothetical protein
MSNKANLGLIFFVCSNFTTAAYTQTKAIESLLGGLREVIDAGKVYVEDTDLLTDKLAVYSCADRYTHDLTFQPKSKEKISEYYACLKSANENEYSSKNTQFAGFEEHLIQFEDDEEFNQRNWFSKFMSKKVVKLPPPLALLKKTAEDIGKFAFINTAERLSYKPRDRFAVTIKDALLLILDRQKYGEQAFDTKLREKLTILASLCIQNTVFQAEESPITQQSEAIESEYSAETLIEMGQRIGAILASAGGQLVLPYKEKVTLGVDIAQVLFPIYSSILRERAENKDLKVGMSELVKLGDEEIKIVEKVKAPGQLEDDFDAKFYAVAAILYQINKQQASKSTKSVKKAEFKERNPLENAFKL